MVSVPCSNTHYSARWKTRSETPSLSGRLRGHAEKCAAYSPPVIQGAALEKSNERREREDLLRIRIAALEARQNTMESVLKISLCSAVAFGLGWASYKNWDQVQSAAQGAWQKMPTFDQIKTLGLDYWGKFESYFRRSNP